MFLGLLVEHVKSGDAFPDNAHAVFERYVESRLTRDADRVRRRYRLEPEHLRETAERVAFCISADSGLGLTPLRDQLRASLVRFKWAVPEDFDSRLDALEFIKLARFEATNPGEPSAFNFSHRRFQEYFATCVLLRGPTRVSPTQLLTDGRWREPAVVLCQTRDLGALGPILEAARALLGEMGANALSGGAPGSTNADGKGAKEDRVSASAVQPYPWPAGCLHLLGILQDGFSGRIHELPEDIRSCAGRIISKSFETGTLLEKKWGLEVAGSSTGDVFNSLLRQASTSDSDMLRDIAFQQVARAVRIPADISDWIRKTLVRMGFQGRLLDDRVSVRAHLSRLEAKTDFMKVERMLFWAPIIDLFLCVVPPFAVSYSLRSGLPGFRPFGAALVGLLNYMLLWIAYASSQGAGPFSGPIRALVEIYSGVVSSLGWVVFIRSQVWLFMLLGGYHYPWGRATFLT
jgi:hypothetical protein